MKANGALLATLRGFLVFTALDTRLALAVRDARLAPVRRARHPIVLTFASQPPSAGGGRRLGGRDVQAAARGHRGHREARAWRRVEGELPQPARRNFPRKAGVGRCGSVLRTPASLRVRSAPSLVAVRGRGRRPRMGGGPPDLRRRPRDGRSPTASRRAAPPPLPDRRRALQGARLRGDRPARRAHGGVDHAPREGRRDPGARRAESEGARRRAHRLRRASRAGSRRLCHRREVSARSRRHEDARPRRRDVAPLVDAPAVARGS